MDALNTLAAQHLLNIQKDGGDNSEVARIQSVLDATKQIRSNTYKKDQTPAVLKEYSRIEWIWIRTLIDAQWQTAGLLLLSDQECLKRAYSNNQNIYYDGYQNIYIAGINSIKDVFINDLTIPLRLTLYTDR